MGKNNMTFYQAMQLGAERLKPVIDNHLGISETMFINYVEI